MEYTLRLRTRMLQPLEPQRFERPRRECLPRVLDRLNKEWFFNEPTSEHAVNTSKLKDAEVIAQAAQRITSTGDAFDRLVRQAGQAELVLIGEASHGTHEFYE